VPEPHNVSLTLPLVLVFYVVLEIGSHQCKDLQKAIVLAFKDFGIDELLPHISDKSAFEEAVFLEEWLTYIVSAGEFWRISG